jgi:hypothetical protein
MRLAAIPGNLDVQQEKSENVYTSIAVCELEGEVFTEDESESNDLEDSGRDLGQSLGECERKFTRNKTNENERVDNDLLSRTNLKIQAFHPH